MYSGRSGVSGAVATVFGSSGFLGRQVVSALGSTGTQVILPFRGDGMNMRHLKTMGDLGQIVQVPFSARNMDSVRRVVEKSNIVINLLGAEWETNNFSFEAIHNEIPAQIAQICKSVGVERFIHVSALGSNENATSKWLSSKARGEESVLNEFPTASIIRPAIMFGEKDKFLNRYADIASTYGFMPLFDAGSQLVQPVFVRDVSDGIMNIIDSPTALGAKFDFAGPKVFTLWQVIDKVCATIHLPSMNLDMPYVIARLAGRLGDLVPQKFRMLSADQVEQMRYDMILNPEDGNKTLADVGVHPSDMESMLLAVLVRHRGTRHWEYE